MGKIKDNRKGKNNLEDLSIDELRQLERKIDNERQDINSKLSRKEEEYSRIMEEIYFKAPPINTDGILDLKIISNKKSPIGDYELFLHGTDTFVGKLDYRGYHYSEYLADVGGAVKKEHRGHGYLYKGLILLGQYLNSKGINDFWVSAYEDNIPSIKSIEKYVRTVGGEKISHDPESHVVLYDCLTRTKQLEDNTSDDLTKESGSESTIINRFNEPNEEEKKNLDELYEYLEKIENEIEELEMAYKEKIEILRNIERTIFLKNPPTYTNGIIDLRIASVETPPIGSYDLYFHGTDEMIAHIYYNGYHTSFSDVDVSFGRDIDKEYNYQGLVLFGEYLNSLGINDFLVNTSEIYGTTELAVELIEKYIGTIGGKMIDYNQDKSGVLYECLTKSKKMDNSEVKL